MSDNAKPCQYCSTPTIRGNFNGPMCDHCEKPFSHAYRVGFGDAVERVKGAIQAGGEVLPAIKKVLDLDE